MVRYCFTHIRIVSHQWAAGKTGQQFEEEMLLPRVEAQKDLRNRCPHWLPHDLFFDVFCIILGASSEFTWIYILYQIHIASKFAPLLRTWIFKLPLHKCARAEQHSQDKSIRKTLLEQGKKTFLEGEPKPCPQTGVKLLSWPTPDTHVAHAHLAVQREQNSGSAIKF